MLPHGSHEEQALVDARIMMLRSIQSQQHLPSVTNFSTLNFSMGALDNTELIANITNSLAQNLTMPTSDLQSMIDSRDVLQRLTSIQKPNPFALFPSLEATNFASKPASISNPSIGTFLSPSTGLDFNVIQSMSAFTNNQFNSSMVSASTDILSANGFGKKSKLQASPEVNERLQPELPLWSRASSSSPKIVDPREFPFWRAEPNSSYITSTESSPRLTYETIFQAQVASHKGINHSIPHMATASTSAIPYDFAQFYPKSVGSSSVNPFLMDVFPSNLGTFTNQNLSLFYDTRISSVSQDMNSLNDAEELPSVPMSPELQPHEECDLSNYFSGLALNNDLANLIKQMALLSYPSQTLPTTINTATDVRSGGGAVRSNRIPKRKIDSYNAKRETMKNLYGKFLSFEDDTPKQLHLEQFQCNGLKIKDVALCVVDVKRIYNLKEDYFCFLADMYTGDMRKWLTIAQKEKLDMSEWEFLQEHWRKPAIVMYKLEKEKDLVPGIIKTDNGHTFMKGCQLAQLNSRSCYSINKNRLFAVLEAMKNGNPYQFAA